MPRHRRRRFARNRRAQRKRERLDRIMRDFVRLLAEYPSIVTLVTEPLFPNLIFKPSHDEVIARVVEQHTDLFIALSKR